MTQDDGITTSLVLQDGWCSFQNIQLNVGDKILFVFSEKRCSFCHNYHEDEDSICESCWLNFPDFYPLRERKRCLFGDPNSYLEKLGGCSKKKPSCGFTENVARCFKKHTLYLGRFRTEYKIGISGRSGKWIDLRLLEQGFNEGYVVNGMQSIVEARYWEDWFINLGFPSSLSSKEKCESLNQPLPESIKLADTFDIRDWEEVFSQYKVSNKEFHTEYKGSNKLQLNTGRRIDGDIIYIAGAYVVTSNYLFSNLNKFVGREIDSLEINGISYEVRKEW